MELTTKSRLCMHSSSMLESSSAHHYKRVTWRTKNSLRQHAQASIWASALTDSMHLEANLFQLSVGQDASAVEHEGWLHHLRMEVLVWICLEFVPLSQDDNCMRAFHRLVWRLRENQPALVDLHVMVLKLAHGILFLHLGIIHMHHGPM